eukprot:2697888-Pyramimonas_sp.AAC.1
MGVPMRPGGGRLTSFRFASDSILLLGSLVQIASILATSVMMMRNLIFSHAQKQFARWVLEIAQAKGAEPCGGK